MSVCLHRVLDIDEALTYESPKSNGPDYKLVTWLIRVVLALHSTGRSFLAIQTTEAYVFGSLRLSLTDREFHQRGDQ